MKPRLLDLFCGAGGATRGYQQAGFHVTGVDINPQPNYVGDDFIQADALDYLGEAIDRFYPFNLYDAIHASPPCQRYSTATKRNGTELEHPDLIAPLRRLLKVIEPEGIPYVIENVPGAPLHDPIVLCGSMFNLAADGYRLKRHRMFELSWRHATFADALCYCHRHDHRPVMDVTGGGPTKKPRLDGGGGRPFKGTADQARRIMGIDWMTKKELNEAIPPAYTRRVGFQLRMHLERVPA